MEQPMTYEEWYASSEFDADYVIENFIEDMKPYVTDMECFYTGFWSQGDGASFTGSVNFMKVLDLIDMDGTHFLYRELMRTDNLWQTARVTRSGSYYHEQTMDLEYPDWGLASLYVESGPFMGLSLVDMASENGYDEVEEYIEKIVEDGRAAVLEWLKGNAQELYRSLEQEYEYQTSEEAYNEWREPNEVEAA
jgi:hypothetical protein